MAVNGPSAEARRAREIRGRLERLHERIQAWCQRYGRRPEEIRLLAVSKTFPPADVRAAAAAGQCRFGESYVAEALAKQVHLAALPLEWHFIGPIQSNKTRRLAAAFDWIQSLDTERLARRLDAQRPPGRPPLNVLIQVNVSGEASKRGVAPAALPALAEVVAALPRLRLRGLMAIPAPSDDFAAQRRAFAALRGLQEDLQARGWALDVLSMGMSGDLEAAIAEGATLVRVGTGIFGPRPTR
ncbi:MAG: YggS family pyridoxal phosphate-dependent enzyme [Gammaproteobacteria bacterium]|nr:MAG: YggS family pyridoxal phosphate-dependent enzyme [Gammaproteobacteria bacterium]